MYPAQQSLPKLLYIGDVPVETTVYGAAQLYRLLSLYPAGDLLVIEANAWRSRPQRRLAAVRYGSFPLGNSRLLNSRFHSFYGSWLLQRVRSRWWAIDRVIKPFVPEAVLTVTHGYSWIAAAEYALQKRLPLHLVLHDDWPGLSLVPGIFRNAAHRLFAHYYQRATTRLCISPSMAEIYQRELSSPATVLFPCCEPDAMAFDQPPARLSHNRPGLVVGYGGTLNAKGQVEALLLVAEALARCGGKLILYGPIDRQQLVTLGLDRPNIEVNGLVSSKTMIKLFREAVDALLVPLSLHKRDQRQNLLSFPSKLADYTTAGLPLLIIAPPGAAVVQWAENVGGVAEIVTEPDPTLISAALNRLALSPEHRVCLATRALHIQQEYFTHGKAWGTFCAALELDNELVIAPNS